MVAERRRTQRDPTGRSKPTRDTPELKRIKKWYDRVALGWSPSEKELEIQFGEYADQADWLVRRVRDGQSWQDFIEGIDGAPAALRKRLAT
jgi:hypothetical protein